MDGAGHALKRLFEPIEVKKGIVLRNRIVMPAACTNYGTEDGYMTQRLIDYHTERAKGGAGLIILEVVNPIYPGGKVLKQHLSIHDDKYIPMLKKLADAVHSHGAKIAMQLSHAGRQCTSDISGQQPWAPSAILPKTGMYWEVPKEMTIEEIHSVPGMFAEATKRAIKAGFDGVEFHYAHGYLFSSFMSPYTNKRTDEYGGSLENRMKFALETVRACREAVGPDYWMLARINGDDFVDGGVDSEEAKVISKMLVDNGIDLINVSAGMRESTNPIQDHSMRAEKGNWVYLAEGIKKFIPNVPVATVNRITEPELAEEILEKTDIDLVCVLRALMADPYWPQKAKEGRSNEITRCIGCCQGCYDQLWSHIPIGCMVNPEMGRETELPIELAKEKKKVLVVGGGPGGMMAALTAKQRGHDVTLCEKDSALGGQLQLAVRPPHKREIENLTIDLIYKLNKHNVKIELGMEVTPEYVDKMKPDVVVIATGVKHLTPDIPGIRRGNVIFAEDVLLENALVGKRVVVIGAGRTGLETAEFLRDKWIYSRDVTVLSRRTKADIVMSLPWPAGQHSMSRVNELGIDLLENVDVKRINDEGVLCEKDGKEMIVPADTVINARGVVSNTDLAEVLEGKVPIMHKIGDCVKPRTALDAAREGFDIGLKI